MQLDKLLQGLEALGVMDAISKASSGATQAIGAAATQFTQLTDTPNLYTGDGGKFVNVRADEIGLEFTTLGALALRDTLTHGELIGVGANDHHARYTDAEVRAVGDARYLQISNDLSDLNNAATARSNLGLGALAELDTLAHGALTGIGASDHHAKYTDAEAITAAETKIGSTIQAWDAQLDDIAALDVTQNDNFIVSNGANWTQETPSEVRTTLGLVAGGTGDIWVEKAGDEMTGDLTFDGAFHPIIDPGADTDAVLLQVTVTGTPQINWDESEDAFSLTNSLIPDTDIAHNLGSVDLAWDNLYVEDIRAASGENLRMFPSTADDSDDKRVQIGGGGAISGQRGAVISIYGNEAAFLPGGVAINLGVAPGVEQFHIAQGASAVRILIVDQNGTYPGTDSARDLGSSSFYWDETFTDELVLQQGTMGATAADQVRLAGLDLSAGDSGLHIKTENDTEHLFASLVGINTTSPTAQHHIQTTGTTIIGQKIEGTAAQTANLSEWLDSADNVHHAISLPGATDPNTYFNKQLGDSDFVIAGDNEANLLRVDAGLDAVHLGDWDTNYFVTDNVGDTWWVGGGGLIFGSMYANSVIAVVIGDNNPTEVEDAGEDGWTVGELNGVNFPTGGTEHYITITKPGKYEILWNMSFHLDSPGANVEIHGEVMINGSAATGNGEAHRTVANTTDTGNMSAPCIADLPNGNEEISLWIQNATNTANIDVVHATVTLKLIGGT